MSLKQLYYSYLISINYSVYNTSNKYRGEVKSLSSPGELEGDSEYVGA
jgi:hypothetical protein